MRQTGYKIGKARRRVLEEQLRLQMTLDAEISL